MPRRCLWVIAMSGAGRWRDDLEKWLQPFLAGLSHPARWAMCPLYVAGLIGLWRRGLMGFPTIGCTTSSRPGSGMKRRCSRRFCARPIAWSAVRMRSSSSTTPPSRRRGIALSGSRRNTPRRLGKTANCQTLVSLTLARGCGTATVPARDLDGGPGPDGPGRRARGPARGSHQAGDRGCRDRPGPSGWRALRLRAGGCGVRLLRPVPAGPERARLEMGRRDLGTQQGLPGPTWR